MKIKNNLMFYLFLILVVFSLIDYFSAGFVLGGEANPIFLLTGSMFFVLAIKVLVLAGLGYFVIHNVYNSHFGYYLTLIILVLSIGTVGIAAAGNIYAAFTPHALIAASSMTTQEKVQGYTSYLMLIYLLPLILSLLSFKFYEWSIGKAEFKRKTK